MSQQIAVEETNSEFEEAFRDARRKHNNVLYGRERNTKALKRFIKLLRKNSKHRISLQDLDNPLQNFLI